MKIVIPDKIDFTQEQLQQLQELNAIIYDDIPNDSTEIIKRAKDAEIITANYIDITPEIIDKLDNLKYIVVPAVGYEWVDVKYASSKGITVVNCPTFNSQSVAEMAFTLALNISRKIIDANVSLYQGKWDPIPFTGYELSGKRIGLIGYGNVGKRVEKIAMGFDMHVAYINSESSSEEIDNVLRQSDYVVLCVQLNEKTKHMIDARRLALMNKDAFLINVCRGAVVDQSALLNALKENEILGAGLDVFEDEPLIGKPSDQIMEFAGLQNVLAIPHIAANTHESHKKLGNEVISNFRAIIAGTPVHIIA